MSDAQASLEPDAVEPSRMPEYVRGQVLRGKYELLRPLESGGMGVVWIARDRVLNVEVALKLIQRPPSERMEFTRRALSEARLAAKLSHPAVCRATDFGLSEHGDPFVVSELLTGESLEERITRAGRMEPVEAVQILLPILDALRAAHELGIVHRDVKPGNVFLAKQWSQGVQPKLLDFGIARWVDESGAAAEGICGTPCYMSPEQARGSGDVDPRSDLWNFCATLYELCTGVPPFDGSTGAEVIAAVQSVDPPPITAYSAGDEELAFIIARGLRRERDERWSSAEELTGALSRWLLARGVETDGSGRSLRPHVGDAVEGAHALPSLSPAVVPAAAGSSSIELQAATRRFWAGVLAGAALVLPLTSFQLVRAAKHPIAEEVERAPAAAPIVAEQLAASTPVTPVRAADAPELTLTTLESSESSPEELAGPPPPPSTRAPIEIVPAPIEKGTPSASAVPAPAPPPRAATPKRAPARSKGPSNALGYDFGF